MIPQDDNIQKLWQQDRQDEISAKEQKEMMKLIREKRTGFSDLTRSENQNEYLAAIIMGPLLALVAWKAKYPWVRAGYGLCAAAWLAETIALWLSYRGSSLAGDDSLLDHLRALILSYDHRLRFVRNCKIWISLPMALGVSAVILGIPKLAFSVGAWSLALLLAAALCAGQWLSFRSMAAAIGKKREEAAVLLREMPESQTSDDGLGA